MNFYIVNRGGDLFRVEFYSGNQWQGAVLCSEDELDGWVKEWEADVQLFARPCSLDKILDDFCYSAEAKAQMIVEIVEDHFDDNPKTPHILN